MAALGSEDHSEFELFEGETHITVPGRSVTSTLRFAFTWP